MSRSPSIIPNALHPPYQLPLERNDFESAIQRGHGRAFQHTSKHSLNGVEDLFIHACTHNLRYDTQCEDAAQDWLIHLGIQSQSHEEIFPRILNQIERTLAAIEVQADENPRHYLAGTLYELAKNKSSLAKELLYKILSNPHPEDDMPGSDEVIKLDGCNGLVQVFNALSKLLSQNQLEQWTVGLCLSSYDGHNAKGEGLKILREHSKTDPKLNTLLEYFEAEDPPTPTNSTPQPECEHPHGSCSYGSLPQFQDRSTKKKDAARFRDTTPEDVIQWVHNAPDKNYAVWIRRWAFHAPQEFRIRLAHELITDENPHHILKYLRAFSKKSPLILIDKRLLTLADHSSHKIRWAAYNALATCDDPLIRSLALSKRKPENLTEGSLSLFSSSYQPGDHIAIEESLFHTEDQHDIHTIGFSLLDIFKERDTPESLNSMLYLYEHGPCMNCRYYAVQTMQKAGVIPDWISQEAQHDADGSIRELITGSEHLEQDSPP